MNHDELAPELACLEMTLAARQTLVPTDELKGRVLLAVRRELGRRESRRLLRYDFWQIATTAACILVWLNLSMSMVNHTQWKLHKNNDDSNTLVTMEYIRELAPELSESEARRQALLLKASARLIPAPNFNSVHFHHRGTENTEKS
ncbi:MAG: hypothetical protein V1899_03715 [Planctomycetota bacterium]